MKKTGGKISDPNNNNNAASGSKARTPTSTRPTKQVLPSLMTAKQMRNEKASKERAEKEIKKIAQQEKEEEEDLAHLEFQNFAIEPGAFCNETGLWKEMKVRIIHFCC